MLLDWEKSEVFDVEQRVAQGCSISFLCIFAICWKKWSELGLVYIKLSDREGGGLLFWRSPCGESLENS